MISIPLPATTPKRKAVKRATAIGTSNIVIVLVKHWSCVSDIFLKEGRVTSPPSLRATIRSPLANCALGLTDRHRSRSQAGLVVGNDLADDRENLGSRVDAGKFVSHLRRTHAVGGSIEHGADGGARRVFRRFVGRESDPDAGPRHSCVDGGLILGHPCGVQRNSKAHG